MITLSQYQNKKVGVFGLGISGQATIAALLAGGAEVYAWDDKAESVTKAQEVCPQAKYRNHEQWPWKKMDLLVMSPGIPLTHPEPHFVVTAANVHGCRIAGDIELLAEACPDATFVGITGTNGKSTTTALVAHILESAGVPYQVGGNLGMPALGLKYLGRGGVYVLEVSSYQLDLLSSLVFNVAALLNITPDHLDRHGGMEGYISAKKRVFGGQRASDTAVIGVDTEITKKIWQDLRKGDNRYTWQGAGQKVVGVSTKKQVAEGLLVHAGIIEDASASFKLDIGGIPSLLGEHNWQNAGVAYAICRALNLAPLDIFSAMKSFPGLAHRMKLAGQKEEIRFVNDSKATNAEATENALKAFEDIYWILGGKAKEGGIESLTAYFPKIKKAYLIGEAAPAFAKVLEANHVPFQQCGTLNNAFAEASEAALKEGKGVVLLSPACASFDQFRSFEHRGDVFHSLVDGLLSRENNKQIA